jgi:ribosomal protein S18 acetylase RimI-like enzyme
LALVRLENPESPVFRMFLEDNQPLSYRISGAIAEADEELSLWVDDIERPGFCVHRTNGRLAPLGPSEAVMNHIGDLEEMARGMDAAGELPNRHLPEEEGIGLRLTALPREVRDVLAGRRRIIRENGCGLYILRNDDFTPCEEGPPLDRIREEEIPLVSDLAEYGEIDGYVSRRIEHAPYAAVRIGDELAAYMIVHDNGSIGMLHTLEKFRNRKLGRRVASALAEMQMERGRPVYCYIVNGNTASERVFTSLGFKRVAEVSWVVFERAQI